MKSCFCACCRFCRLHPSHEMCKTNDGLGVVSILGGCQGGVRKCRLTASIKYFTDWLNVDINLYENRVDMAVVLLRLSLCAVTLVQLTSSQPTYDVTQRENDVSRCERTDQLVSQLVTVVSQLRRDVAELKAGKPQYTQTGWISMTSSSSLNVILNSRARVQFRGPTA